MDMINFHSWYTLLAFIVFIGICFWAWSKKRQGIFSEAANLPFADDEISNRSALTPLDEEKNNE